MLKSQNILKLNWKYDWINYAQGQVVKNYLQEANSRLKMIL